jgi:hypothetical protein
VTRGFAAAVCAVCALVVLAGTAAASRDPTASEAVAIRAAIERFVDEPGSPARGAVLRKIRVSTVNSRFAIAKLRSPEAPALATAVLERRTVSRWRVVTFGLAGFAFRGVPEPVLNDLLGATLCDCR